MADVVAGFLGPAIELGKCIFEPIKRQFNYLCCFSNNVQNLRDEAKKLEDTRGGLRLRVDEDENNARVVIPQVMTWFGDASSAQAKICEIDTEITAKKGCFNVKSRYSLGRKVKKTADAIKELRASCDFNIISHPPPPAAMVPTPQGSYSVFESRKDIEEGVMTSLRDNETYRVGICGMGGVGKTTMAKKIMHRVREENLFEEILMVVISQKVCQEAFQEAEMLRIQDDVAVSLGLDLAKGSLSSRAHTLRMRLSAGTKRCLMILDDIWGNLNLDDLGIACDNRCKVLFTSRDRDVLKTMDVEKVHAVKILTETEAWRLFESNVGSCIGHPDVVSVAQQVAAECKGLPIALVTVGAALKNTEKIGVWKDWLDQLKSGNPIDLPKVLDGVYRPLRSSYEFLNNERAQALFLMCCLYAEDANIPIEELAIYAKGLHMLGGIKSLEEARNRVCTLVEMLKSRFLLLEGISKDHVKMHDVVRDVAIFTASEKKLITHDSKTNDCTWISPNIGERIELHAGLTIFPNLRLLWIGRVSRDKELEIDDKFFEVMKELNVLSIRFSSLEQLPQTTRILDNLQTLVLEWCESLESISVVGELVNLEILICFWCKSIKSLPTEIGRLRRLRLLKLSYCDNLKTIAPGIISNLKGLEELIIEGSFDEWEAENTEKEKKNASLSELEKLSSLSRLTIKIKDSTLAAQQMQLSPNLVGYHIRIGDVGWYYSSLKSELYEKKMELTLPVNINLGNWIDKCVRSAEFMVLNGDGSSMVLGVAQNVRELVFQNCSTVKKLMSKKTTATIFPLLEVLELHQLSELKEICDIDAQMPSNSFSNLKELRLISLPALEHLNIVSNFNKLSSIYVCKCDRLQSLFSSLPPLERLEIKSCDMMEQVFLWNHGENQMPLVLPKLKSLKLYNMPKLMSFIKGEGIKSIEFPVLEEIEVNGCPLKNFVFTTSSTNDAIHMLCNHNKIKFDCLGNLKFDYWNDEMGRTWCPQNSLQFSKRKFQVSGFKGLKNLFSLSTIESNCLPQLERLEISNCDMMEEVILWNEKEINNRITPFPKLKLLKLFHLPRLTSFSHGFESIEFPVLEEMIIEDCPIKSFVFTSSSTSCPNNGGDDAIHLFCKPDKVKFDNLSKLQLRCGNDMRIWCPQIPHDFFARLRELKIKGFNSMKTLFSLSTIKRGCFSQLEKLKISECEMMEEVILWDEEENRTNIHITLFPKLKLLALHFLPKLTSLSKGIQFTPPAKMRIKNCPLLESCVSTTSSDDDDYIHLYCKTHKVEFSSLKELEIVGYDGTRRNWCPQLPMIDIFSGLSKLSIKDVNGVKSLFSCSVARNLHSMKVLYIWLCKEMVKVIEDDACGGETSPFHLFPNLEELDLYELPKLKSFCEWRCALEFPLLKILKIFDCELMEKFTSGPLNTPILEDIDIEDIDIEDIDIEDIDIEEATSLGCIDVNAFLQQRRLKSEEEEKRQLEGSSVEIKEEEGE